MPNANPVAYPLGAPVITGPTVTVDTMLDQPTRITRYLSDLTLTRMWFDRVFANPGGVTGGALIYDQLTTNDIYPDRDVQNVEPGAEFPIVTSSRAQPKVAQVEKYGAKCFITDEARDRNDQGALQNNVAKIGNAIVRKTHARAIAELDAAIAAIGAPLQVVGLNWNTVITAGTSATSAAGYPAADFAKVQLLADQDELGVTYDLWLLNPAQVMQLALIYGPGYSDVLASFGVSVVSSNRIAAGTAYAIAEGQVGEYRLEKPLGTETWREPATERTWVQTSVRPVFAVTNPYSVRKITGLAG